VKEAAGLDFNGSDDMDTFSIMAAKTRSIRVWWEALTIPALGSEVTVSGDEIDDFSMDILGDDWLRDVIGSWNE
jgi:hypothetical protein